MSSTVTSSASLVLRDDGNLVLSYGSRSSQPIWQSFDHQTHTFLPGELQNQGSSEWLVKKTWMGKDGNLSGRMEARLPANADASQKPFPFTFLLFQLYNNCRHIPMDFDDNEYQGQNLQLAWEGCSKVSSVLHPYPIPKFDFDDSLHGHLRFDSSVEKESFLGITSQEDNQWIEEYSRESSRIQLSSSAVESRRNNVWSEATSSESVEMLLRSVGQEEKIVEETVIQHLDLCNEPGSLTKVMDPNLNLESQKAQISSGELESVVENDKLNVMEAKVDKTFDDATKMDANNAENESMDKELLEEPSVTAVENPGSSENVGASTVELRGLENMQQVAVNASGLSEDFSSSAAEHDIQSKQISIDVPDVKAFQKPSLETSNAFGENPSQMIKSEC